MRSHHTKKKKGKKHSKPTPELGSDEFEKLSSRQRDKIVRKMEATPIEDSFPSSRDEEFRKMPRHEQDIVLMTKTELDNRLPVRESLWLAVEERGVRAETDKSVAVEMEIYKTLWRMVTPSVKISHNQAEAVEEIVHHIASEFAEGIRKGPVNLDPFVVQLATYVNSCR